MVSGDSGKPEPPKEDPRVEKPERPALSPDFYRRLLDLPSCRTRGVCDGCGRCEH